MTMKGQDNWKLDPAKTIKLEHASNWITMGLDGKIALSSSGDVIDVKSHKIVAQLKDEYGNLIHSEKFLELGFRQQRPFDACGEPVRRRRSGRRGSKARVAGHGGEQAGPKSMR